MKILLVRTWPTMLDVTKQTYNIQEVGLAKALMRRGHQVDLLFWTNEEEKDVLVPVAEGTNIHVFYRHGPVALKCVFFPHMKKLAEQYDILQTGEYSQLYSWHLAGKYPDKTVIYHGPYYAPFNRNYNRLCWGIDHLCLGRYKRLKTPFLTKSRLAEKFLTDKGLASTQVIPVGVGVDAELLSSREEEPFELAKRMRDQAEGLKLLYIGRIEPRRDPGFLLRVVEELHKRGTAAKLYVVGDGDDTQTAAFAKQIKAMGLTEDVIWQRKARQQQLGAAYHQADFFLLPTEYEIFGMVLLEAMFFETVALTTPNGGADMLIQDGENGVVLTKDHPEEWAERILVLQGQPERKRRMGAAARETVTQHFTWDALAGTFEQVYEQKKAGQKA